jgi:hypothetical protein
LQVDYADLGAWQYLSIWVVICFGKNSKLKTILNNEFYFFGELNNRKLSIIS